MSPSDSAPHEPTRFGPMVWSALTDDELLAMPDAEFDRLTADVAALLHEGPVDIELERPSESLWYAIADGARRADAAASDTDARGGGGDGVHDSGRPLGVVQPLERRRGGRNGSSEPSFKASSRWSGRTAALTLVAAGLLLVMVPLALSQRSSDPEVLAAADLEVLDPDAATFGHADLVLEDDAESLSLDFAATAPAEEYLELWLLAVDGDNVETLSLGRVDGDGTFEIPEGVDRTRFNIVDISIEADDGDESHSGRSILRGELVS